MLVKYKEGYRLMKAEKIIEEGTELCKDISKSVGEMRKGVSKGFFK